MLDELLKCPTALQVVIGRLSLSPTHMMTLQPGQVRPISDRLHRQVELVLDGQIIARGELVNVEGSLGVRVTSDCRSE